MIIRADNQLSKKKKKKKKNENQKKKLLKNTGSMTTLSDIVGKAIVWSLLYFFSFMIYFQRSMQGMKMEREILDKRRRKTLI